MPRRPLTEMPFFRSELQARLLAVLFSDPERAWTGPDLRARTGISPATLSREMALLEKSGLLEIHGAGPGKTYRLATSSPLYEPLLELVERTVGVEALLTGRLSEIDGVDVAAIFGSWARKKGIRPTSDVDVIIIGNADFDEIADAAADLEPVVGREIQVISYSWDELDSRIATDSGFVKHVLAGPLTALVGDTKRLKERAKR